MTYVETMKAAARASEVDAHIDQYCVMCLARRPLDLARNTFPRMYPRMVEIIQQLGASGLMALPTEATLHSPIAPDVHRYLQAARADAPERMRLFRLAWDVACSSFGAPGALRALLLRRPGAYDERPLQRLRQGALDGPRQSVPGPRRRAAIQQSTAVSLT
jgi:aromatic ring hydroxylase